MSKPSKQKKQLSVAETIRRKTIISFTFFAIFLIAGLCGWLWLYHAPASPRDPYIRKPLRAVLDANERLFKSTFDSKKTAKTFAKTDAVKKVRVNGNYGLGGNMDTANWRLHVICRAGDTMLVSLDEIKRLPKTEVVFDFKCIEGWDQVTHWGGVRLSDFLRHYKLDYQTAQKYIGLETPDKAYYVGIDMKSALQEQTILCYEMNGAPLPQNQGFPLRLIIPVKYGIKHLKRIGTLFFSDKPPRDFWAEQGYDYYSGH